MRKLLVGGILMCLAGCVTTPTAHDFCAVAGRPILWTDGDVMTKDTKAAIVAYNEKGLRLGCWKKPAKK